MSITVLDILELASGWNNCYNNDQGWYIVHIINSLYLKQSCATENF